MPEASDSKRVWRKWALERHADGFDDATSAAIVAHLSDHLARVPATTVVLFSSLPGEVDVQELSDDQHHRYALTRTPDRGGLTIHDWSAPRERHRFGFSQPVRNAPLVDLVDGSVVLVPGLAFDRAGIRLGRGAGYYDELFARLGPGVIRIGVTPAALVVDRLPAERHDMPMHLLATEDGLRPVDS